MNQTLAAELRDPTKPLPGAEAVAHETNLKLQAIFSNGADKTAVINGKNVRVGDWIGTWSIEHINKNSVHLKRNGRIRVVNIRAQVSSLVTQ